MYHRSDENSGKSDWKAGGVDKKASEGDWVRGNESASVVRDGFVQPGLHSGEVTFNVKWGRNFKTCSSLSTGWSNHMLRQPRGCPTLSVLAFRRQKIEKIITIH